MFGFQAQERIERLWPPEIVLRRVKEVRLYIRTVLSEQAVATIGREGCGDVSQQRVVEEGVRVARGVICCS